MTDPPAVVIELPIEGAPVIHLRVASKDESIRLRDWIKSHPELEEIRRLAARLARERRTA